MADAFDQTGPIADARAIGRWTSAFAKAVNAGPSLLFGLRLWTAVCLALFVAFWLELDNPFWAGTSAAIVCQPQLGASLRKGWFRMIGTVVGATMIVVLTACFPQDRIAFLVLLAVWCGHLRFRCHGAPQLRILLGRARRLYRSDHCRRQSRRDRRRESGCLPAGGHARERDLHRDRVRRHRPRRYRSRRRPAPARRIICKSCGRDHEAIWPHARTLQRPRLPDTKAERREFVRRVIALDPVVDQTLGESSHVRYHSRKLQTAMYGLFRALDGWRGVATHLESFARGRKAAGGPASSCEASRPSFDRCRRRARRRSGFLILWPCTAFVRRRCGH